MSKTLNEASGKYFMSKNLIIPSNPLLEEIEIEKQKREAEKAAEMMIELQKKKQEEINKKLEKLELLPMGSKIIILPYPENPYKKVIQGSIIVDYTGDFINPDSGEKDKLKELVACAKVIEVGPECKYLKQGDDIYFDTRSVYPVPFMSCGYQLTTEQQVLCVLNESLKERFNMK